MQVTPRGSTARRCSAFVLIVLVALLGACTLSVNGVPVDCQGNIDDAWCLDRATMALTSSLPADHPELSRVAVVCDADRCDADEGPGHVIVSYVDGPEEVIDWGFGHT